MYLFLSYQIIVLYLHIHSGKGCAPDNTCYLSSFIIGLESSRFKAQTLHS